MWFPQSTWSNNETRTNLAIADFANRNKLSPGEIVVITSVVAGTGWQVSFIYFSKNGKELS